MRPTGAATSHLRAIDQLCLGLSLAFGRPGRTFAKNKAPLLRADSLAIFTPKRCSNVWNDSPDGAKTACNCPLHINSEKRECRGPDSSNPSSLLFVLAFSAKHAVMSCPSAVAFLQAFSEQ